MMEILPEIVKAEREAKARRKSTASSTTSEVFLDDLAKIKKGILLKSNRNVSRYTVCNRLTEDQVLKSLLPDEVLNSAFDYETRKLVCVVIFADVSGFTDLSDKYQSLENGASKLSMVLNFYIGSMVQEILSQGGDIIKYAGDAFLAIFRAENELEMQEAVHKAINSSLTIQKNCSNYRTDIESLNVKIAISCGEVLFSLVGNDDSSHYVIVGQPVWDVKMLQEILKPGETLVSHIAWLYTQESLYIYRHEKKERHYQLYGFKDSEEVAQRQYEAILDFQELQQKFDRDKTDQNSISMTQDQSFDRINATTSSWEGDFTLRKSKLTLDFKSRPFLRRFVIQPVLKAIDLNEPIELLTEMRHVVIVFADFVVKQTDDEKLVTIVDGIYKKLNSLVTDHEGILNKVSLFDKDLIFLIIFGLRGLKHQLESRVALRCASELHETFKNWPEVVTVSLGVTTGMSYCGIVGHTLRREYSVISVTVNKAARLMMAYPNIVSCDQETLLYSKLELKHFRILPKKKMKGLREDVIAYKFKEIINSIEVSQPLKYRFPLFGQSEVIELSQKLLKASIMNFNQKANGLDPIFHKISCLVIEDDKQQGKTRVLGEIHSLFFERNLRCLHLSLSIKHLKLPFFVTSEIMRKALNIESSTNEDFFREEIAMKFDGLSVDEYLCLLNPILGVNFETSEAVKNLGKADEGKISKIMFKILCTQTFQELFILLIDNIEHLDDQSFKMLECLFGLSTVLSVITLGNQRKLNDSQGRILDLSSVTKYQLQPIDRIHQNELACQFLNVSTLSVEFEEYLHKYSEGNPGWILSTSDALLQSNKIEIRSIAINEISENGFVMGKKIFMTQKIKDSILSIKSVKESEILDEAFIKIAMLTSSALLKPLKITRADNDLMTYDSLSSYEQLVCKCAAVVGVNFTRHMLSYIMSNSTDRMIGKAVVKLFETQVFKCTSIFQEKNLTESDPVVCKCRNLKIFDSCRDLPKYSCCAAMKFQRDGFRTVVYDSLTDKQRIEYHRRALLYLHMETRRCESCGKTPFAELLLQEFDFEFHDGVLHKEDTSSETMLDYFNSLSLSVKRNSTSFWPKCFPMLSRNRRSELLPVVLNFQSYDFNNCSCNSILYSMYSEMTRHCHGAGTACKLIESKIELAGKSIKVSNISFASSLLSKALSQLDNNVVDDDSLYYEYLRGRVLTLQGVCLMTKTDNQCQSALELFYDACSCFGVHFPRTYDLQSRIKFQSLIKSIKKSYEAKGDVNCSKLFSLVTIQLSKTLSLMFKILFKKKLFNLAKLAAFWSLRKALKFRRRFSILARSFTNVFKITFFNGTVDNFLWLQDAALELTNRTILNDDLELDSLTTAIEMYNEIMMCQIARNQIRIAIKIGQLSLNLCPNVQLATLPSEIVPTLFLLLMSMTQIQAAQTLLDRYGISAKMKNDEIGQIWYHALCMDILLDTSQTIESYDECYQFHVNQKFNKEGHCEAHSRFFANMFLWSVRHKLHRFANTWMGYLSSCFLLDRRSSFNNIFTRLRVFEALTIQLGFAFENRNLALFENLNKKLADMMEFLDSSCKHTSFFAERYELHKIHLKLVKRFREKQIAKLDNLMKLSLRKQNYYSFYLIQHSKRSWSREMPLDQETFWIDRSKEKSLNLKKCFYFDRVFPFSLPIPASK